MKKIAPFLVIMAVVVALFLFLGVTKRRQGDAGPKKESARTAAVLVAQAKDLETKGAISEVKGVYQKLVSDFPNSAEVSVWQKKIEEANMKLLLSASDVPAKTIIYEIKPGDSLEKIAKTYKTTVELLQKSNNLSSPRIVAGKKIRVWTAPFSIIVYKGQNILILKTQDEIIKTYIVSTGANNSTPVGTFTITSKLVNPTWFKPGAVVPASSPDNVLGTRWMGFNLAGYGIHGTIEPQNLGKQVTEGCVRMANHEVEELYSIVPVGTEVTIFN